MDSRAWSRGFHSPLPHLIPARSQYSPCFGYPTTRGHPRRSPPEQNRLLKEYYLLPWKRIHEAQSKHEQWLFFRSAPLPLERVACSSPSLDPSRSSYSQLGLEVLREPQCWRRHTSSSIQQESDGFSLQHSLHVCVVPELCLDLVIGAILGDVPVLTADETCLDCTLGLDIELLLSRPFLIMRWLGTFPHSQTCSFLRFSRLKSSSSLWLGASLLAETTPLRSELLPSLAWRCHLGRSWSAHRSWEEPHALLPCLNRRLRAGPEVGVQHQSRRPNLTAVISECVVWVSRWFHQACSKASWRRPPQKFQPRDNSPRRVPCSWYVFNTRNVKVCNGQCCL